MNTYITRENFSKISDYNRLSHHHVDFSDASAISQEINQIGYGCLVNCRLDYVNNELLNQVLSNLTVPINLILNGGDYLVNHKWLDSPKIKNIFSPEINGSLKFNNTKLHTIPWGFEMPDHEAENLWKNSIDFNKKQNKIFFPYHSHDPQYMLGVRIHMMNELYSSNLFSKNFFYCHESIVDLNSYFENLKNNKFCIVLPGAAWAVQPRRVCECWIMKTVPVMLRKFSDWWVNSLEDMCALHNLPIVFVDSWDDINSDIFNVDFDFSDTKNALLQNYWDDFILSERKT